MTNEQECKHENNKALIWGQTTRLGDWTTTVLGSLTLECMNCRTKWYGMEQIKEFLEERAYSKGRAEEIDKIIILLTKEAKELKLGEENRRNGASSYNWYMFFVKRLESMKKELGK